MWVSGRGRRIASPATAPRAIQRNAVTQGTLPCMSGDGNGELLATLTATLAFVEQVMEQRAVLLNTVERGTRPSAEQLAELCARLEADQRDFDRYVRVLAQLRALNRPH
jgi:hypothetical protein